MKHCFKLNKLIRDQLYQNMLDEGVAVHSKELTPQDCVMLLKEKLVEEAQEVLEETSKEELIVELADVLEVISSLAKYIEVPMEEIKLARQAKRDRAGGFDQCSFVSHIEVPEGHRLVEYCRRDPKKYPEKK